jgi:NADH dehydrogenase
MTASNPLSSPVLPTLTTPRRVLVLGGTGFVGRALASALCNQPNPPALRIPSRRPVQARALAMLRPVELIAADVHDPADLDRLLAGCDTVVNLVAALHGTEASFEHTHVELPRQLIAACQRQGVRRLIHVSALGVDETAPETLPSMYLRSKARGEGVLRAAATSGAISLSLLRPSVIFGTEDRFVNLFAELQQLAPLMALAGAEVKFQPVWVGDVAAALAHCLFNPSDPSTAGQALECAGPEVLSLGEIVRRAGAWSGNPRPVLPLPEVLGLLQAKLLSMLPGPTLMSPDNLRSMRIPNVATGRQPGLASLGIAPASMEAVMAPHLANRNGQARSAHDLRRMLAGRD